MLPAKYRPNWSRVREKKSFDCFTIYGHGSHLEVLTSFGRSTT